MGLRRIGPGPGVSDRSDAVDPARVSPLERGVRRLAHLDHLPPPPRARPDMVGPNPHQPPTRYLVSDDRDFFAVYRRLPGPVTIPFK